MNLGGEAIERWLFFFNIDAMKILYYAIIMISHPLSAINIHNVQITPLAAQIINISLTTEATELYYFDSWHYSITGNVLTVNAYFIEGFGSTIAYLNNNFQVLLPSAKSYMVVVRIFYTDTTYTFATLQDIKRLAFRYPKYRQTSFFRRELISDR